MKHALLSLLTVATFWTLQSAEPAKAQDASASIRNTAEYSLDTVSQPGFAIALQGYDPVAYFPEGGGGPQKGLEQFRLEYMGATYLFASSTNLNTFLENPEKYEPTYGGWCAFAMASGSKVEIVPAYYTLSGNRLHLFFSRRAKANFDRDVADFERRADEFWKQISGESPRI